MFLENYSFYRHKAYILPHLEFRGPLLLGIGKDLNRKLESGKHYTLKTLFNIGKTADYDTVLKMASVRSIERRQFEQSQTKFLKCARLQGTFLTCLKYELRVIIFEILL